jgi:hypothetical protein
MVRAIQLDDTPFIAEELPEAEEVEEEVEVAATAESLEVDNNVGDDFLVSAAGGDIGVIVASGVYFEMSSISVSFDSDEIIWQEDEKPKEPEKTFLLQPSGRRIILIE